MVPKISSRVVEDGESLVRIFKDSLAGTEEKVKASQDRVEMALRLLQESLDKTEALSRQSRKTAEAAIKASQEAIYRANEICTETEEFTKKARIALEEAMDVAHRASDSVIDTSWVLSRAAKEAIETPGREAKKRWWNG